MTLAQLIARFPEIPADLREEPLLAELAERCGAVLEQARKPAPCSTGHDAGNHYYLALIGPLSIYGYGLASREKVLGQIREILDREKADPEGFAATLLPEGAAPQEVRGPGCD